MLSAAMICAAIAISCRTPTSASPRACIEKPGWSQYGQVALEKQTIFAPTPEGDPTRFVALANRIDYLESTCVSINAFIRSLKGKDGAN